MGMKRFLMIILSFIFLGGAVTGSALLFSGCDSVQTESGGGISQDDILENDEVTANAPTNDGYWTDAGNYATSFAGGTGTEGGGGSCQENAAGMQRSFHLGKCL